MANVERLNYELGKIFNGYMNKVELETGEVYRDTNKTKNGNSNKKNRKQNILNF